MENFTKQAFQVAKGLIVLTLLLIVMALCLSFLIGVLIGLWQAVAK